MTIIKQNIEIPLWGGIKVFVAVTGQDGVNTALEIANQLRSAGVAADMDFLGKSLKAQLRMANKLQIPYVLILGPDELKENAVLIKDMEEGTQETVSLKNILFHLKSLILKNKI